MNKSDVFWIIVTAFSVPVGLIIGFIVFELKEFLDDNVLHKDFNVEKFIEENTVDSRGVKWLDLGNAKLWQCRRVLKHHKEIMEKLNNES